MKMDKRKLVILIGLLTALGGITAYAMTSKKEPESTTVASSEKRDEKEDPYKNINKNKVEKIKLAEISVDELIREKGESLETKISQANNVIKEIGDSAPEIEEIQQVFL